MPANVYYGAARVGDVCDVEVALVFANVWFGIWNLSGSGLECFNGGCDFLCLVWVVGFTWKCEGRFFVRGVWLRSQLPALTFFKTKCLKEW